MVSSILLNPCIFKRAKILNDSRRGCKKEVEPVKELDLKNFNDYFDRVPYLETQRFILRPISRNDMDEYFEILRDEQVQKYLGGGVPLFDKEPHISNWLNNIN